jgi:beta-phosphoglucomutase-like phosphatase (HAD superfamily)
VTAKIGAGLFLDLDGTLADSLTAMRAVYGRFLDHLGKVGNDAEFARLNGPPLPEIVASLAAVHECSQPLPRLLEIYRELVKDTYCDVVPNPGACGLLKTARDIGLRVAVVTSNTSSLTRTWLQQVGFAEMVDAVIGSEDVSEGKPNPAPYLLALERTGCDASVSLAVEDSLIGARAAMAAEIRTILLLSPCDAFFDGIIAIDRLDDVTELLAKGIVSCGKNDDRNQRLSASRAL